MKIFLDDDPMRDSWVDDTWVIVRTADAAWDLLVTNRGQVEELSLDHDLGDNEDTGYGLMRSLEECAHIGDQSVLPKRFSIHSANPVGRKNMQAAIDSIERIRDAS